MNGRDEPSAEAVPGVASSTCSCGRTLTFCTGFISGLPRSRPQRAPGSGPDDAELKSGTIPEPEAPVGLKTGQYR